MTTPFHDLDDYIALPRVTSLAVAPDGSRIVAGVAALDADHAAWVTNLWEIPTGTTEPAGGETGLALVPSRLTRGAKGESTVAFTPDGDLLFVAAREEDSPAALHLLPRTGGEPRVVATHPGGITGVVVAGTTAILTAPVLPGSRSIEDDEKRRKDRKDAKVSAILHRSYPVRFWDHDLGPAENHLYAADLTELRAGLAGEADATLTLRDLTPDAGAALEHAAPGMPDDGSFVVTTWTRFEARAERRAVIVRIDVATGERTELVGEPGVTMQSPRISPDGRLLAFRRSPDSTPDHLPDQSLRVRNLATGEETELGGGWDRWATEIAWLHSSKGLVVGADDDGRSPLFLMPLDGSAPTRLTDEGAYSAVHVLPDDEGVVALRASYEHPSEPVRISLPGSDESGAGSTVVQLPTPAPRPTLPGRLEEIETVVADGSRVRAFLALPDGASAESPAPLLLWIHGGPLSSWNAWSWRWNPWAMVARGYAVLLPDPALSTGYGIEFIRRGWASWGSAPYEDLMAITDVAEARDDVDETRTAAMGGSFGGYMANWVAGHTDRFDAIVTHASLWALDQFGPTTDSANYWRQQLTGEALLENSPHLSVGEIRTPMLVIHGDKDYRVPIGEGLRLWYELLADSGLPAREGGETAHRFLYFPNENHWVLNPQHSKLWYEVVLGFLAEHVLGEGPADVPALLR